MSSSDIKQELLRLGHVLDRYEEDLNIFNQQPKKRRRRSRRKRKPYCEPPLGADVTTGQEATDQIDRGDTSDKQDEQDGSTLPDTSGDTEADTEDNTTAPVNAPQQPTRLRRRRILPTPPRELPPRVRIRKPPAYLKDYITKQAIGQTSWLQKVECLTRQLKEGMFRGMENDITRTIIEIVKETS
ncbi:unnamed protein product [Mytilus coruscus]|uniref:Uncharacterized protein n=1 Tax=Mytilus coruscus TaxID=42192 RepID=A0A6J8EDT7_MYTCO|nr:unnamed protein product [Mytilus coruscus]